MLSGLYKFIYVAVLIPKFTAAQFDEHCNELVIEGDSSTLDNMFLDLHEITKKLSEIKLKFERYRDLAINSTVSLPLLDLRFDKLPKECETDVLPKNCREATSCTERSGIYKIQVDHYGPHPFYVECDADTEMGEWLVIQKRQDGSENFQRNWYDYEEGFGDVDKEFFIGLKKIYALTNFNGPQELLIIMKNAKNIRATAKYNTFSIADDKQAYRLKSIGIYSGTAGDELIKNVGKKFSTTDVDNGVHNNNCTYNESGAWWHDQCFGSTLNGKFGNGVGAYKGIIWGKFSGSQDSLKYVKMMLRRRRVS